MTTLLRYQPKQTLERRYSSSSSSNSSPTHEQYKHTHTVNTQPSTEMTNPHYQYIQSLYNDKQRELQSVQHIIHTQLTTLLQQDKTHPSYNAVAEVFYTKQRQTLLHWEMDATNELHALKEKLDSYRAHSMLHNPATSKSPLTMNGVNGLSDTSSSSSSSDDD